MTDAARAGRRVVVMGLGLFGGGAAAARFCSERGADVTVTDLRDADELAPALRELADLDVRLVLGRHDDADFRAADDVVVNPAVPPHAAPIRVAREHGARITSEVALFLDHVAAPVVAVTGTQGKSSTCRFLADLCAADGRRVHLGGNIGRPLLAEVDAIAPEDLVVLEVSSYQLAGLPDEWSRDREDSPIAVGLVTNILADHLERHGTRDGYIAAKLRLFELLPAGAPIVVPADADWLANARTNGLRVVRFREGAAEDGELRLDADGFHLFGDRLAPADAAPGLPDFQRRNLLAALGAARLTGTSAAALAGALPALRGLPHRFADLGLRAGRRVIDNAVSTTPDSTVSALRSAPRGATALIGGKVKDLDTEELVRVSAERAARVVLFGEAATKWHERFAQSGLETHRASTVAEAVAAAFELSAPGDTILFSPACSSFDAYANFQARADDFHARLPRGDRT